MEEVLAGSTNGNGVQSAAIAPGMGLSVSTFLEGNVGNGG